MPLVFRLADNKTDFARCVFLRGIVFGAGQNIAVNDEIDDLEETCRHVLGLDDGQPCATARWRVYKPGVGKIERVAVHPGWQGRGIGLALMEAVAADIKAIMPDCTRLRLGAQDYAIPFYQRLGFEVEGEGFMDAGIPHHWMEKAA